MYPDFKLQKSYDSKMTQLIEIETERLKLRQWKEADFPVFARINADPEVMQYFPNTYSEQESNAWAIKIQTLINQRGWGLWALETKSDGVFIGFVGLHIPIVKLPFSPCIEIGWRLAKASWGKGYATEAAKAALNIAFEKLKLTEIVSFTAVSNTRSRAVMERLHMENVNQNFFHPSVPEGSAVREHVLYKLSKARWQSYAA